MHLADKRMQFVDIEYEVFNGVDGSVMERVWKSFSKEVPIFTNSNYLACCISHLSIYKHALEMGHTRVLVVEDDCRIRRDANDHFSQTIERVPPDWELLYLGFIPLSDDCSRWDYNTFSILNKNVAGAKNFWGLFGYGITDSLMKETLELYDREFPMELDRHFVTNVQPRGKSYGIVPQVFAAEDGISDNSGRNETGMLQRSVDARFGNLTDYV